MMHLKVPDVEGLLLLARTHSHTPTSKEIRIKPDRCDPGHLQIYPQMYPRTHSGLHFHLALVLVTVDPVRSVIIGLEGGL